MQVPISTSGHSANAYRAGLHSRPPWPRDVPTRHKTSHVNDRSGHFSPPRAPPKRRAPPPLQRTTPSEHDNKNGFFFANRCGVLAGACQRRAQTRPSHWPAKARRTLNPGPGHSPQTILRQRFSDPLKKPTQRGSTPAGGRDRVASPGRRHRLALLGHQRPSRLVPLSPLLHRLLASAPALTPRVVPTGAAPFRAPATPPSFPPSTSRLS